MCGIGGFWGEPAGQAAGPLLDTFDRALHHRGPDEGGRYVDADVGLLIRRLSIIDLVTGTQPIKSENDDIVTVFNGEIYNHVELRKELQQKGHTFKSRTDTEVIVHLYEEEGTDFLHRLRGMFAIALWDRRRRRLLLARDRLGIKPLHYSGTDNGLVFASEIGALLAAGASDELEPAAIDAFFRLGYVPSPSTCYRHIRSLPPGSYLLADAHGMREARWWRLSRGQHSPPRSMAEARERVAELLVESVRLRLISDVPLGAFLSGGLDSSLIVGMMAAEMTRPVETFTIGFDVPEFDETEHSDDVARSFATNQHVEVAQPDTARLLGEVIAGFGQPFADPSAIPTLLVSRLARRHVTVVLSGDGGDELFGGYTRYGVARAQRWYDRVPQPLRSAVAGVWPKGARGSGMLRIASQSFAARYMENNALTTADERQALLEPEVHLAAGENPYKLGEGIVQESATNLRELEDLLFFDLHSYLPDDILAKVDRMSMQCSLEARVPFLDHELVEYAFSIPLEWRMGSTGTKRLLREAFAGIYPVSIRRRSKMGFGVPLDTWLRGPLREELQNLPRCEAVRHGPLRLEGLRSMVESHLSGRANLGRKLWALLVFNAWWSLPTPRARQYFGEERTRA